MAYLIDKNGNKVNIELDVNTCRQVKIYSDGLEFEDICILNLYRNNGSHKSDFELVQQIKFRISQQKKRYYIGFSKTNLDAWIFIQ